MSQPSLPNRHGRENSIHRAQGCVDLGRTQVQFGIGSGQISPSVSGSVLVIAGEAVQPFMKISQSQ